MEKHKYTGKLHTERDWNKNKNMGKNLTEYWWCESEINDKNAMITERMHVQMEKITKELNVAATKKW